MGGIPPARETIFTQESCPDAAHTAVTVEAAITRCGALTSLQADSDPLSRSQATIRHWIRKVTVPGQLACRFFQLENLQCLYMIVAIQWSPD